MPDRKSKPAWEAQNMIKITVKINRNQDPELYELLTKAPSKSGLARDLMNQAINQNNKQIKKEETKMANCPWDASGKIKKGVTVREYAEFCRDNGNHANFTIDGTYYNLHSLLIAPPDDVDLDAIVIDADGGYYGTPGVKTK